MERAASGRATLVERFAELQGLVAGILVGVIVLIIAYGAIMRYLFRAPAAWSIEIPSLLFLVVIGLGLAYTQAKRGHASVEAFVMRMPISVQRGLELAGIALFLLYALFIVWSGWNLAAHDFQVGQRAMISKLPLFAINIFIPIGLLCLSLQLAVDALHLRKPVERGEIDA